MNLIVDFLEIQEDELYLFAGGCGICTAGTVIGSAATGAGIVLALASNPVGWAVAGGALIGASLGYLVTR